MSEEFKIITIPDFYSKELDNHRYIRVYLPKSYENSPDKHYPVLYMHDGQNLFDSSDSLFKETWNVHKTVDKLINEEKIKEIIVVGIDNNTDRGSEYCHFMPEGRTLGRMGFRTYETNREVKGILYEEFIINSLKPYIDSNFRTLTDRDNTAMMGSSLGGLVTYNIGFRHPEVFGMLGLVSPAFNWSDFDKLLEIKKEPLKIWMDCGEGEAYYVDNSRRVIDALLDIGYVPGEELVYYQVPNAIHNEACWAKRIHMPLLFFFGTTGKPVSCELAGRNVVGKKGFEVFVNPIVQYESGFAQTDINGKYTVENPDVMEIKPNGLVIPKTCGSTRVTYEKDWVKDSVVFNVIDELSETVTIGLDIQVPSNTPPQEKIRVSIGEMLEPKRNENGIYQCSITVPRDWGYHFSIFMGDTYIGEVDKNGRPIGSTVFKATEDMNIEYKVERWAGL